MGRRIKERIRERVTIEGMAAEGKCIARLDGMAVFVPHVAPGDVVDLRIYRQRKHYAEAEAIHFHHYSEQREEPFCEHFGTCGGCKWQHISYAQQLAYKQQQVVDALERIAKVPLPPIRDILPAPQTRYYRNKLEFTFSPHRWLSSEEIAQQETRHKREALGFHVPGRFDRIVDLEACHLQPEPSNAIRLALRDFALAQGFSFYDVLTHQGLLRNLIVRHAPSTEEWMVLVQFGEADSPAIEAVMQFLKDGFPQITSLQYVINTKRNETFHDLEVICFAGQDFITEQMENLRFKVGAKSFFQTNTAQALALYRLVRDWAAPTADQVVYDLYTGTGTIACFVASQARHVIGIEYVEQAIVDARNNAAQNGLPNTTFLAGDMKDTLTADFLQHYPKPDVIITDPPRAGMHERVVERLLELSAPRIVYVSCNPATQARDIHWLRTQYAVREVQPVDMFPHTQHVESVVVLERT
ncbi:MAG: 23S rRNA (uracil(1939)-C(5))-methyltransferase RlmD [Bernardetiaceae bacterium]